MDQLTPLDQARLLARLLCFAISGSMCYRRRVSIRAGKGNR
jgi:hypothetical protein